LKRSSGEKILAVSSCGFHQSFPKKKVINDTKNSTQHLRDRVASQKCTVFSFARESSSSSFDQADIKWIFPESMSIAILPKEMMGSI